MNNQYSVKWKNCKKKKPRTFKRRKLLRVTCTSSHKAGIPGFRPFALTAGVL
jgi:hypothetical protein